MEISVTDPDALEASRTAWSELGLPALPQPGARFVAAVVNADGRLAAYWLSAAGERWVLWAFDPRDRLGVGRPVFPAAWMPAGPPPARAAAELLEAHWLMLATYRRVPGPEVVIEEGLLDARRLGLHAGRIWPGPARRPRVVPGDPRARLELAAARMAIAAGTDGTHLAEDPLALTVHAFPHLRWCGDGASGPYAASLVVGRVCGWRVLAVHRRTLDGDDCLVYGMALEDRGVARLLRRVFERNGHPDAPLFPSPPTAVVHAGNAPARWAPPILGADQAQGLIRRAVSIVPGAPHGERIASWFELVTDPEHVVERCRRMRALGIEP